MKISCFYIKRILLTKYYFFVINRCCVPLKAKGKRAQIE